MRAIYAIAGTFIGVAVDLAINLLAASIQARTPEEEFAHVSPWVLLGLIVVGLLAGLWRGKLIVLEPRPIDGVDAGAAPPKPIKIRRLQAFLSYGLLPKSSRWLTGATIGAGFGQTSPNGSLVKK